MDTSDYDSFPQCGQSKFATSSSDDKDDNNNPFLPDQSKSLFSDDESIQCVQSIREKFYLNIF